MVGPERKREAVLYVQQGLAVSERRACTLQQPRSMQRYRGQRRKDAALRAELRRISAAHPRAGYPEHMVTALLRRAGMEINAKRVQRLWRQEGQYARREFK